MVSFNLIPAPSTPVPFVSACRLWRRGLKWWLLIGIEMLCCAQHNISMEAMRQEGISEILTHDNHFTQEGFTILL
jgi:hypothetical protein